MTLALSRMKRSWNQVFYTIPFHTIPFYSTSVHSIIFHPILFYFILLQSIPLYSILFYSISYYFSPFHNIPFYSILFQTTSVHSIIFHSILFYFVLLQSIPCYSIQYYSIPFCLYLTVVVWISMSNQFIIDIWLSSSLFYLTLISNLYFPFIHFSLNLLLSQSLTCFLLLHLELHDSFVFFMK